MDKESKEGTEFKEPFELAEKVDLQKFATGTWYVISHIPLSSEPSLNESETYTLGSDGKIKIEYRYTDPINHTEKVLHQTMWPLNNKNNVMRHQINEAETIDYGILDIDTEGYQWMAVVTLDKKNCWIMARKTTLETKIQERLIGKLGLLGFQIVNLQQCCHKKFDEIHHQATAHQQHQQVV